MADEATAFAPGRVNLIGEHTDYNEGLALPFAIAEGVTVTAESAEQDRITALAADLDAEDSFSLTDIRPAQGWRAFVRGVAGELQDAGVSLRPATLVISGDIPRGAGLSSSAALEVSLALALLALVDHPVTDRLELARMCSRVENDWVGARTGLLDQIASLYGEQDHAVRIDFRSLEVTPTVLELGGFKLVTLDSGERHSHAKSGYNERRAECAEASKRLGLESLRDATVEMAAQLPAPLDARVRHVVSENQRVEEAVEALGRGDLEELGALLNASHASLRDNFEVSTPAVEATVERLRRAGALGARIVGGGFGGAVLGLLPPSAAVPAGIEVRPGPGAGGGGTDARAGAGARLARPRGAEDVRQRNVRPRRQPADVRGVEAGLLDCRQGVSGRLAVAERAAPEHDLSRAQAGLAERVERPDVLE
jgi:galactokinase